MDAISLLLSGEFDSILLPELGGGMFWDLSALYSDGIITAGVPEPGTLAVLTLGLCGITWRRRR